jgi:hypothetical protein
MQHLAGRDQVLHGAGDVLHRHGGIDPVLVEKVDAVGAQALQHGPRRPPLMWSGRLFTPPVRAPVARSISKPNLVAITTSVAERRERLAQHRLIGERPIGLGRVEQGDAAVEGRADDRSGVVIAVGGP